MALWLHGSDTQALHDSLAATGVPILTPLFAGPSGRTFAFADLDGYAVTIHDKQEAPRHRPAGPSCAR